MPHNPAYQAIVQEAYHEPSDHADGKRLGPKYFLGAHAQRQQAESQNDGDEHPKTDHRQSEVPEDPACRPRTSDLWGTLRWFHRSSPVIAIHPQCRESLRLWLGNWEIVSSRRRAVPASLPNS